MRLIKWFFVLFAAAFMTFSSSAQDALPPSSPVQRCINLANTLEAPNEGEWGVTAQADYFRIFAETGFDTVRLPIKWSGHALTQPPYTIDPAFFDRVDEVVGWALDNDLQVIIDFHHYDEIMVDAERESTRLLALWDQIATHYADYPSTVLFEVLNEPNSDLTEDLWNFMQAHAVAVIRQTNPIRTIIVGGGAWNSLNGLFQLQLPDDENLIATFHYYEPFQFTHQGTEWNEGTEAWVGTEWGSDFEYAQLEEHFAQAAAWGAQHNVPLMLGEFAVYHRAPAESRYRWTEAVRTNAETYGIGWCYWDFAAGFGVYDLQAQSYTDLITALFP